LKEEGKKLSLIMGWEECAHRIGDAFGSETLETGFSFKDARNYFKADIGRLHLSFEGERESFRRF